MWESEFDKLCVLWQIAVSWAIYNFKSLTIMIFVTVTHKYSSVNLNFRKSDIRLQKVEQSCSNA